MREKKIKYSIVIPTYNEKHNICILISSLKELFASSFPDDEYEIIVCDDDSPDLTWQAVKETFPNDPKIKVIRRTADRGLSQSIMEGFDNASGEILVVMDADLQHDPNSIPELLKKAETADLVAGTRFALGGSIEGDWPVTRKLMSFIANLLAKIILGIKITDPMSGFFAIKRTAFQKIRPFVNPKGFKILLELLFVLITLDKNAKIAESGVFFRKRTEGKSKMGIEVALIYLLSLFKLLARKKSLSVQVSKKS